MNFTKQMQNEKKVLKIISLILQIPKHMNNTTHLNSLTDISEFTHMHIVMDMIVGSGTTIIFLF